MEGSLCGCRSVVVRVGAVIPSAVDQAEPSRHGSWRPGRSYSGALHLDARTRACSTVCGSTADGMTADVAGC